MTTEAYPGPGQYTVAGTGPYEVGHEYGRDDLVCVIVDESLGTRTELAGEEFTVTPLGPADNGDVFLTAATAAAHAGKKILIVRNTSVEQGWTGQSSRERGNEAVLDVLARGIQDRARENSTSIRLERSVDPIVPVPGRYLSFDEDGDPILAVPDAELQAAQEAAESARDAAQVARAGAESAATTTLQARSQALQARDEAQASVWTHEGQWATGRDFSARDVTYHNGGTFLALQDHTANVFATDLAAGYWVQIVAADVNRNLAAARDTGGTGAALTLDLISPPPAMFDGFAGAMILHADMDENATLDLGFGAYPLRIRSAAGALEPVTRALFVAHEVVTFTVQAGPVVEITSQPGRELVAGPVITPLQSQMGDFNLQTEGGEKEIRGNWSNGPLGAASVSYDHVRPILKVFERRNAAGVVDLVVQTLYLDWGASGVKVWRRVGRGAPLVWTGWANADVGGARTDIGQMAFLAPAQGVRVNPGDTFAGSALRYAGVSAANDYSYNTLAAIGVAVGVGTWRAMGAADTGGHTNATLFQRIA